MSRGHIVVDGALCKCKFGNSLDTLVVLSQKKGYINDSGGSKKLIATTMDLGTPLKSKTFGQCKLQPSNTGFLPCIPAIIKWQDSFGKVILSNQGEILTEKSKAICAISGMPCIEFTWHGQTANIESNDIDSADEEILSQLNPLVNIKKMAITEENNMIVGTFNRYDEPMKLKKLLVKEVEGILNIEVGKTYTFRAAKFSRNADPSELEKVKWAIQIDDGNLIYLKGVGKITGNVVEKDIELVEELRENEKIMVFAYVESPVKEGRLEYKIKDN